MKTITVTLHRAYNYGAVLQAYALQKVQESLGYDNKLLNYYEKPSLFVKCFSKNPVRFVKNMVMNIIILFHLPKVKKFASQFDDFRKNHLIETKRYESIGQIQANPPVADCYITGSDQVWNFDRKFNVFRFLEFGDEAIAKYSYAASLSCYSFSWKEKSYIKERLKRFEKISVRENTISDYINSFTEIKCQRNLDPVFLLDKEEWERFAKKPRIEEPYILCYAVIGNKELQNIINQIKKTTHLPVVLLQTTAIRQIKADMYIFDADPQEFLGLIQKAEFIVTTSFHGTALSIIFEKNFHTVIKSVLSERMTDLLNLLQLSNRVIGNASELSIDPIDYSQARNIMAAEKKIAIAYLESMKINECIKNGI